MPHDLRPVPDPGKDAEPKPIAYYLAHGFRYACRHGDTDEHPESESHALYHFDPDATTIAYVLADRDTEPIADTGSHRSVGWWREWWMRRLRLWRWG